MRGRSAWKPTSSDLVPSPHTRVDEVPPSLTRPHGHQDGHPKIIIFMLNRPKGEGSPTAGWDTRVCTTLKGSFWGDPMAPNSPASVASRYFLAPQAKILRI